MIKTSKKMDNQKPRYDHFQTLGNGKTKICEQKRHRVNSNDTWLYIKAVN